MPEPLDLPLAGVRVIDLTAALAGPLGTMILADLGADVVKLEPPDTGEMARDLVPSTFVALNRNKSSVAVDLKSEAGRELARALIGTADVVASSFRPGVMADLGLGAEDLRRDHPGLIWASLSAFGEDGPRSARRGMDLTVRAESGLIDGEGNGVGGIALVDYTTGMAFAQAMLAALVRKRTSGQGAVIECRLLDAGVFLQASALAAMEGDGSDQAPDSQPGTPVPTAGVFPVADGSMVVAVFNDRDWVNLCRVLGREDLLTDPRFAERSARLDHGDELRPLLGKALSTRTRQEWADLFDKVSIMVGAIQTRAELLSDTQIEHNGTLFRPPAGSEPAGILVRLPFSIDGEALPIRRLAPLAGQDSVRILTEAGYDQDRVRGYLADGVISGPDRG